MQKKEDFKKIGIETEDMDSTPINNKLNLLLDAAKPSVRRLNTLKT